MHIDDASSEEVAICCSLKARYLFPVNAKVSNFLVHDPMVPIADRKSIIYMCCAVESRFSCNSRLLSIRVVVHKFITNLGAYTLAKSQFLCIFIIVGML